jgi:hypothetical protein
MNAGKYEMLSMHPESPQVFIFYKLDAGKVFFYKKNGSDEIILTHFQTGHYISSQAAAPQVIRAFLQCVIRK